jgi:NAD(P)-dependent dehydrogenase (short-subunit alcohol dehydrogenase family)
MTERPPPSLVGSTALVTGGAAGIGKAVAERLGSHGAAVVIADIDATTGESVAAELNSEFVQVDMASKDAVATLFSILRRKGIAPDILVNNAGGAPRPYFPDAPVDHWLESVSLNLTGPMFATQLVIPMMTERCGGAVINVASIAGLGWGPHDSPEYAAAKAGLVRLTSSLVPLREKLGIRVHCVCPDWVDTPSSRRNRAGMSEEELQSLPPLLDPSEVADEIVELAKDTSSTGKVVLLRGGFPPRVLPATHWNEL